MIEAAQPRSSNAQLSLVKRERLDVQPAAVKGRKTHRHPGPGNVVQREGHVERHAIMDEPQGFIQRLVP